MSSAQPSHTVASSARRRNVLGLAVSPLLENLETRSHFSVNAAPTANPGATYSVNEGQSVLISGLASTDSDGTVAGYQWDTNYNAAKGFKTRVTTPTFNFTADTSGPRTIALRVTDNLGGVSTVSTTTINVADVAPTITLTAPATAVEGQAYGVSWTHTDPGVNDTVTAWTIDWGDDTTDTVAGTATAASHTYAEDGAYDVVLTATQADAVTPSLAHRVTVADAKPVIALTTPKSEIFEGEMVQLDFAAANRATTLDSWTIDWGDGTTDSLAPGRSHAAHLYADSGDYVAVASAQEPDGGHSSVTQAFKVINVAPDVTLTGVPATGAEGSSISLGSTVHDVPADTHSYGWTVYRNGSSTPFTLPGGTPTTGTAFTFTPTDNGSYVVRLTVVDDEGASTTVNSDPIVVANVNPTATITGTPGSAVNEGATVSLVAHPLDAGGEDTFAYAWTVTRNGVAYAVPESTATNAAAFDFVPRDNGTYVATVVVSDDDAGSFTVATTAFTANNVAPAAAITGAPSTADENTSIAVGSAVTDAGADDTHTYDWSVEKLSPGSTGIYTGSTYTYSEMAPYNIGTDFTVTARVDLTALQEISGLDHALFYDNDDGFTMLGFEKSGSGVSLVMQTLDGNRVLSDPTLPATGFFDLAVAYDHDSGVARVTVDGTATDYTVGTNFGGTSRHLHFLQGFEGSIDRLAVYQVNLGDADVAALRAGTGITTPAYDLWNFDEAAGSHAAHSVGTHAATYPVGGTFGGAATWNAYPLPGTVGTTGQTFAFVPADNGSYRIKLTVTDKDNAAVTTQTGTIVVNNVAPVGTISSTDTDGDTAAKEGAALNYKVDVVDAAADTQTYAWSVTKNGSNYSLGGTTVNASTFAFTPADNGDYVVTVHVTDKDGASSDATHAVTVANVDPTAAITGAAATGTEGTPISVGSTSSDAGAQDVLSYAWSVTKDGEAFTPAGNPTATGQSFAFTPADQGSYVLTLVVTDGNGGTKTVTSDPIVVANAAPVVAISGEPTGSVVEGATVHLTAAGSDAGVNDALTYLWSVKKDGVDYDTGVPLTNATLGFVAKDNGTYVATVVVTDNGGLTGSATSASIVATNAAPTAAITNAPATGNEGSSITVGSTVTDAGTLDTHAYAWTVEKRTGSGTGGALVLDGNGYAWAPSMNTVGRSYTAVARVKVDVDTAAADGEIANLTGGNGWGYRLGIQNVNGEFRFAVRTMNGSGIHPTTYGVLDAADLRAGYVDLAMSVDSSTAALTLYCNGEPLSQVGTNNVDPVYPPSRAQIGGGFVGSIDNVSIYNGVLGDADVAALHDGQTVAATPAEDWGFNEAGGTTAASVSGGTSLTLVNGAAMTPNTTWSAVTLPGTVATDGTGLTFTPPDNGTYRVSLVVTDKDNGTATAHSSDIVIANVAPTGTINGPTIGDEGHAVAYTAAATDAGSLDTLAYAWTVTKDGQPVTLPGTVTADAATFNYTPADQGEYVFACTVTDKDGSATPLSKTLTVSNVSPTVSLTAAPTSGLEGSALTFAAAATDPGDDTIGYAWTVTRNGQAYALDSGSDHAAGLVFTPNDDGSYVVTLNVTDEDGGLTTKATNVAVGGVDPVAAITGGSSSTAEGSALSFGSTVTDASPADTTAGFTYAWTAKRGNVTVATGTTASFGFTPAVHGAYTIKLVATDKNGLSNTTQTQVNVTNVAPTNVTLTGSRNGIVEGNAVNLTAGASDASGDTLTYAWKVMKGESVFASGNTANVNFTAARGDYQIVVTATDTGALATSQSYALTVGNVAPTATLAGPTDTVLIGSQATFIVAANDVPTNQGLSVTWDFGDGTGTSTVDLVAGQSTAKKHAYASRGTYTVTATISDGVSSTVVTQSVFAAEAALITDPSDTSKQALIVVGSDANDVINVAQQPSGKYAVTFNGANLGTAFAPTSRVYVYGNGGANSITVTGTNDAVVFAGGQGGNVVTGAGNDVIVGSGGVDRLSGNGGRDILIGAAGADILHGNDGEDILVAGGLPRMNDTASVVNMMNAWASNNTLASRKNALKATFGTQTIADGGGNQLFGEAGNDWFITTGNADKIKDLQSTDLVN